MEQLITFRSHLFSQRSINRWNSLPQEAVDAPSINCFKNHLEKFSGVAGPLAAQGGGQICLRFLKLETEDPT